MSRLLIFLFFILSFQTFSQKGIIQGKITDELGKPLDFVVLALPNYKIGTTLAPADSKNFT